MRFDPNSPRAQAGLNFWFLIFWAFMLPVTLLTGLQSSVPYVAAISVWALIWSCYVGYIAAKVGVGQQTVEQSLAEHRHHARNWFHALGEKHGLSPEEVDPPT